MLGMVSTVRLFSSLSALLVCCALSRHAAALPIQQAAERPGPPSKTEMQSEHHHSTVSVSQGEAGDPPKVKSNIKMTIPDLEVTDQDGKKRRFYTDLVKGKVVVINFIYTTCTYVCPMQGTSFSKLQAALGDRIGKDVYLISVSTDPVTDTPKKAEILGREIRREAGLETGDRRKTANG